MTQPEQTQYRNPLSDYIQQRGVATGVVTVNTSLGDSHTAITAIDRDSMRELNSLDLAEFSNDDLLDEVVRRGYPRPHKAAPTRAVKRHRVIDLKKS